MTIYAINQLTAHMQAFEEEIEQRQVLYFFDAKKELAYLESREVSNIFKSAKYMWERKIGDDYQEILPALAKARKLHIRTRLRCLVIKCAQVSERLKHLRPLHKSACLEKTAHFDEISNSSEPAYAGRPIGGERESKDREMGVFNKHDHLCNGLHLCLMEKAPYSSKELNCEGAIEGSSFPPGFPKEMFLAIFNQLGGEYLLIIRMVCRLFHALVPKESIDKSVHFCSKIAFEGNLKLLQWARTLNHPLRWTAKTCAKAAFGGHFEVLKWAHENGCRWNYETTSNAVHNGSLEMLQYARNNGCPWDEWTCTYAASFGRMDILEWARKNGCPWDQWTCANAAAKGRLNVLQWLVANGCPFDTWTCSYAAQFGHLEVLKWARENDIPWDKWAGILAARHGRLDILKWAVANGCPWDANEIRNESGNQIAILEWLNNRP